MESEPVYSLSGKRVWVAGHKGMVGSALTRRLAAEKSTIVTVDRTKIDLRRQSEVEVWMAEARPQAVFVAAAKVGGILANSTFPADFLYDNLIIEANIIEGARKSGVEKLVFLGSSCIYPKHAPQPMSENTLLTGPLEPTNQWYAIAKIAGIKMCEAYRRQYGLDFISAMPTNLYGPGDNFDLTSSHVLPAIIRKMHEAKVKRSSEVVIWGTGTPRREFMHVDDCADALVHLARFYSGDAHVNIGSGGDLSILELAKLVRQVVGFQGGITHDLTKPDGTPQKLMDSAFLHSLGWHPKIPLEDGIRRTYEWYLQEYAAAAH